MDPEGYLSSGESDGNTSYPSHSSSHGEAESLGLVVFQHHVSYFIPLVVVLR